MTAGMRVLVTGAGGFVCRHVVESLLKHDCTVVALDTSFDNELHRRWHGQVQMVETDIEALSQVSPDVDVMIHGAALTATPEEAGLAPENHFRANVNPLLAVLEWIQAHGISRAVFLSSDAVYQATAGAVDETQPPTPLGTYAVAKAATESLIATLREQYHRDVLSVRLSSIYGTGELPRPSRPRLNPVGQMVKQALKSGCITVATPERTRAWTYAPDIGEALYHLIAAPKLNHALYNVASQEVLTDRDVAQSIQTFLPHVEIEEIDASNQPPVRRTGYLVNARLKQDTGFAAWTPFHEGIKTVIDWYATLENSA
jgi:UDP-glucose 4-epimerase